MGLQLLQHSSVLFPHAKFGYLELSNLGAMATCSYVPKLWPEHCMAARDYRAGKESSCTCDIFWR